MYRLLFFLTYLGEPMDDSFPVFTKKSGKNSDEPKRKVLSFSPALTTTKTKSSNSIDQKIAAAKRARKASEQIIGDFHENVPSKRKHSDYNNNDNSADKISDQLQTLKRDVVRNFTISTEF